MKMCSLISTNALGGGSLRCPGAVGKAGEGAGEGPPGLAGRAWWPPLGIWELWLALL